MPSVCRVFLPLAALSSRLFAFQSAGITQFGDKATWENASTNIVPISFTSLGGTGADIDQGYPNGIQIGGVGFVANDGYLIIRTQSESSAIMYGPPDGDLGCPPPQAGGCGQSGAGITVSLPPGVTSVGLDVGSFWPPPLVAIRFSTGQVFEVPNAPLLQNFADSDAFVGFTSSVPFDSFVVESGGLPIIRNFYVASASSSTDPFVSPTGVVPIYGYANTIQPGEWVSIYGNNLAEQSAVWNGDFPTSLGGVSVTINGKPAYLWYVSPTQINPQAPDDPATGPVQVVLSTPRGTVTSTVHLASVSPSFALLDYTHVTGVILRQDGSGSYGGGSYDIIGPGILGYPTIPAKAGDAVELFGVGFGPTTGIVPSGKPFTGSAPTSNPVRLLIGSSPVTVVDPSYAGMTSAGLYQVNFTVPSGLGAGDFPITATVAGAQTQSGVIISLR